MDEILYYEGQQLSLDEGAKKTNRIRRQYVNYADKARMDFEFYYTENFSDLDDAVEFSEEKAREIIKSYFDETFFGVFKNNLANYEKEIFMQDYKKKGYYAFDEQFAKVNARFIQIEQKKIEKDREAEKKYSSKDDNQEEKNIQQKLYKFAKDTVNTTMTAIDKTGNSFEQLNEKKAIFENPNTMYTLSKGVYDSVLNIYMEVVDFIIQNKMDELKNYTREDMEKAKNMFENAKLRNMGKEDFARNLLNSIGVYPYNEEVYRYVIRNYFDENGEVEKIADYFTIPVREFKEELLLDNSGELDIKDEQSAINTKENIEKNASKLGLGIDEIRSIKQIDDVYRAVEKFDLEYRTVDDLVFEERSQAELARWEKKKIEDIIKNMDFDSEEELIAKKQEIEQNNFETEIKEKYLTDLNARIADMDLRYRTVDGVEFETRQMSDLAREEKEKIQKILDGKNLLNSDDIKEAIREIEDMDLKTSIEDSYMEKLRLRLEKMEKINQATSTISEGAKAIGKKIGEFFKN